MRVLLVQPYLASYRRPLFAELEQLIRREGGQLTVAAGHPDGAQAARGDAVTDESWLRQLSDVRHLATPLGRFTHRPQLESLARSADVVISELDAGNLFAWRHLARRRHPPIVLWGHGRAFTKAERPAAAAVRARLARSADHVMTYSPSGREFLIGHGVPAARVTAIGNATDTRRLRTLLEHRRGRDASILESFGGIDISGRRLAAYVGGLDRDKRVAFLLAAADAAHRLDPSFLLAVAGSGSEAELIRKSGRDYVMWRPSAGPEDLADLGAAAQAFWCPGRVGLLAIDALALGLPLLTTRAGRHAPEVEFLTEGRDLVYLPDDSRAFAAQALEVMGGNRHSARIKVPDVESVAASIHEVLTLTLDSSRA